MRKSLLLGAALLLSTTALGAGLAAARHAHRGDHGEEVSDRAGQPLRLGFDGERGDRRLASSHHRRDAEGLDDDDDDDDEDGDGAGRGGSAAGPRTAPDPNAPVPDNGLFSGKARPKVDVQ